MKKKPSPEKIKARDDKRFQKSLEKLRDKIPPYEQQKPPSNFNAQSEQIAPPNDEITHKIIEFSVDQIKLMFYAFIYRLIACHPDFTPEAFMHQTFANFQFDPEGLERIMVELREVTSFFRKQALNIISEVPQPLPPPSPN